MDYSSKAYEWYKNISNQVKKVALNLTDIEIKVEEATNSEPWGPHGSAMAEITSAAYDYENYKQIMGVIARRLSERDENWRYVYKALLLLEYMLKHGPQRVVQELTTNVSAIERLQNFTYKDANGKDWGANVRHRAKELTALILDSERLGAERQKARANEKKYVGHTAEEMSFRRQRGYDDKPFESTTRTGRSYSQDEGDLGSFSISRKDNGAFADFERDDPVAATQTRIQNLKKYGEVDSEASGDEPGATQKKRLSTVKVNPNIAASLGLKPVTATTPAPTASAPPPPASAPASAIDLLGGLDSPPAAAAPAQGSGWDAFGGPAKPAAVEEDVWSAFASERATSEQPKPAADLLDLGGDLLVGSSTNLSQLGTTFAPPAEGNAGFTDLLDATTAPTSSAPAAEPAGAPRLSALPADLFSQLTMGTAPQQPAAPTPVTSQPGWPGVVAPSAGMSAPGMAPQGMAFPAGAPMFHAQAAGVPGQPQVVYVPVQMPGQMPGAGFPGQMMPAGMPSGQQFMAFSQPMAAAPVPAKGSPAQAMNPAMAPKSPLGATKPKDPFDSLFQ